MTRRTMAALAVAALALEACGGSAAATKPKTHTLAGTITLGAEQGDGVARSGGSCRGTGGYSDMDGGTPVTVEDEDGTVIGSGELKFGKTAGTAGGFWAECEFPFYVSDLPDDAKFYVVRIGSGNRGELSYSHAELEEQDWTVGLSL
jgi:hypothetical protein